MGTPRLTSALTAAIAVCALTWSDRARAGDDEEVQSAVGRVEAAKYKDAAERFERLLDPKGAPCPEGPELTPTGCRLTNPELKIRAREHYAVALYAAGGRTEEARAQIEAIIRANPAYQPNPTLFPQPLMDLYVEVRGRLSEEIADAARRKAEEESKKQQSLAAKRAADEAYVKALEKQAAEEKVVRRPSRYVASMPFGAGQFQNGDIGLGLFFGISQILAGGTAIGCQLALDYDPEPGEVPAAKDLNLALQRASWVAMGVFGLSALTGVAEAQISFDEETVEMRTRPIPKRPPVAPPQPRAATIRPAVVPMRGGAGLGAVGRF